MFTKYFMVIYGHSYQMTSIIPGLCHWYNLNSNKDDSSGATAVKNMAEQFNNLMTSQQAAQGQGLKP
jgi:hypothetical protein